MSMIFETFEWVLFIMIMDVYMNINDDSSFRGNTLIIMNLKDQVRKGFQMSQLHSQLLNVLKYSPKNNKNNCKSFMSVRVQCENT